MASRSRVRADRGNDGPKGHPVRTRRYLRVARGGGGGSYSRRIWTRMTWLRFKGSSAPEGSPRTPTAATRRVKSLRQSDTWKGRRSIKAVRREALRLRARTEYGSKALRTTPPASQAIPNPYAKPIRDGDGRASPQKLESEPRSDLRFRVKYLQRALESILKIGSYDLERAAPVAKLLKAVRILRNKALRA